MQAFKCPGCGTDHHCITYSRTETARYRVVGIDSTGNVVYDDHDDLNCGAVDEQFSCSNCGNKWMVDIDGIINIDDAPGMTVHERVLYRDFYNGGIIKLPWDAT